MTSAPVNHSLDDVTRPLLIGVGGGGDVAGALAVGRTIARHYSLAGFALGGITWERRTLDPLAGPRAIAELDSARSLDRCAALAGPETTGPDGFRFSESKLSEFLGGEQIVLIDPGEGSADAAASIVSAIDAVGADGVVLVDVGGDAFARGDEADLASPLADAIMLAAGEILLGQGIAVSVAIFGAGCDGELSPAEFAARLEDIEQSGISRVTLPVTGVDELRAAAEAVGSQATSLALRCAAGERGTARFRDSRRIARLTEAGADVNLFPGSVTTSDLGFVSTLVGSASNIESAHARLVAAQIPSELGYPDRIWQAPAARADARAKAPGRL